MLLGNTERLATPGINHKTLPKVELAGEALTHLDKRNTYVRMLFIDYSSAFNTIVPSKLVIIILGLDPALCNWILDLLKGRPPPGGEGR